MTKVDYNSISKVYDQVREEEFEVVLELLSEGKFSEETAILDIGCGTGNYTNIIEKITNAKVYGMDASEGMLEKAKEKNSNITFLLGDACSIPSEENYFSLIYMTDVIHHVSDINKMFADIFRILKVGGKVCIATQSHRQIDLRYMSEFFPSTAIVDKLGYPDIEQIVSVASKNNLKFIKEKIIGEGKEIELGKHYFDLIEKKGYSMLHLISEENFENGLQMVRNEMNNGNIIRFSAGDTLIWFEK